MKQMKKLSAVPVSESSKVYRAVKAWLDTYEDKPAARIDFEYLPEDGGLMFSIMQGALKTKQYVLGGYMAQCQFQIMYRVICETNDDRMKADEVLNSYGEWCEENTATLELPAPSGMQIKRKKCVRSAESATIDRQGDVEIHVIPLILTYEVI